MYIYIYINFIIFCLQELESSTRWSTRQRIYQAPKKRSAWNSTARSPLVAVSIYVQSNYSDETVMQYLLRIHRKRPYGYDEKAEEDCRCSPIRDWFLNVPIIVLEEIALHPLSKQNVLIYRDADMCLVGKAKHWEGTSSMFSGKAKHYFHQLKGTANKHYEEEFLTVGDGFPVENKCGGRGIGVVNTMRKWCCRFF